MQCNAMQWNAWREQRTKERKKCTIECISRAWEPKKKQQNDAPKMWKKVVAAFKFRLETERYRWEQTNKQANINTGSRGSRVGSTELHLRVRRDYLVCCCHRAYNSICYRHSCPNNKQRCSRSLICILKYERIKNAEKKINAAQKIHEKWKKPAHNCVSI